MNIINININIKDVFCMLLKLIKKPLGKGEQRKQLEKAKQKRENLRQQAVEHQQKWARERIQLEGQKKERKEIENKNEMEKLRAALREQDEKIKEIKDKIN